MHDQRAVGHAEDFLHFAGDKQDRHALAGEFLHEAVDLLLRADVDAARGFVEQQQARLQREPFADDDFLLVAAGEVERQLAVVRRLDAERRDHFLRDRAFLRVVEKTGAGVAAQAGEAEVVAHGHFENEALLLAILGDEREARANGVQRAVEPHVLTGDAHGAAARAVDAEEHAQQLGAARANEAGQADDLAGVDGEVQFVARMHGRAEAAHFECGRACRMRRALVKPGDVAPDHQAHHRVVVDLVALEFARVLAVAQDHDAVGEFLHLAEPVGDVDDAHARRAEFFHDLIKLVGLVLAQARGRLVHDEHTRADREGLGDFDQLLAAEREVAHEFAG